MRTLATTASPSFNSDALIFSGLASFSDIGAVGKEAGMRVFSVIVVACRELLEMTVLPQPFSYMMGKSGAAGDMRL